MDELDELVRRHDQYQFEVKLGYDLNRANGKDRYRVETFFFLPNNLDVNEESYSKKQFYRDLLLYIRFKTPDFSLRALTDPQNPRSPLTRIATKLDGFVQDPSAPNADGLEYEIKLLGCVLKSSLRDHIRFIEKQFRQYGSGMEQRLQTEAAGLFHDYVHETRAAIAKFRSFRERLKTPSVPKGLYSTYVFTDEYISLLVEGRTHQLLRFLEKVPHAPFLDDISRQLAGLLREETAYRAAMNYPSIVNDRGDNEVFLFRLSVLKKFVSSILHLSVKSTEEGKGIQQLALAVGAGIAMVFATSIAFYTQRIYGTLSLTFAAALVISYMFKDRIKALSQSYFQKKLARHIFDEATSIYDHFSGEKIGICRQSVHFANEALIDPLVLRLRDRDHITEIENDWRSERVIHHVKEIVLYSDHLAKNQSRKTAVTDIVRFSVRSFLMKMDEPNSDLFILQEGRSRTVQGTRVYHVNVVIKFTSQKEIRYERIRVVLTRQGIKRIEPVCAEAISLTA